MPTFKNVETACKTCIIKGAFRNLSIYKRLDPLTFLLKCLHTNFAMCLCMHAVKSLKISMAYYTQGKWPLGSAQLKTAVKGFLLRPHIRQSGETFVIETTEQAEKRCAVMRNMESRLYSTESKE